MQPTHTAPPRVWLLAVTVAQQINGECTDAAAAEDGQILAPMIAVAAKAVHTQSRRAACSAALIADSVASPLPEACAATEDHSQHVCAVVVHLSKREPQISTSTLCKRLGDTFKYSRSDFCLRSALLDGLLYRCCCRDCVPPPAATALLMKYALRVGGVLKRSTALPLSESGCGAKAC